jgi:SEC-C motif
MAKPGRNDPCPCGSGNKYKKCCLAKDEAASLAQLGSAKTREELTEDAARRAVPHLPGIHELKTAIAARRGMSEDNLQRYDELMDASDAVVDLVRSAKLDAASKATPSGAKRLWVMAPKIFRYSARSAIAKWQCGRFHHG